MAGSDKLKLSATTRFLFEAVFRPQQIGAVMPSSKGLCNAMARWLPRRSDVYVLELGPGTGAVTDALLAHGLAEDKLIAIEKSPEMAELLKRRFPRAQIIAGDAFDLTNVLAQHVPHANQIGAVFCSIPLRNFKREIADDLAQKVRALLPTGGRYVQYTYRFASGPPQAAAHLRLVATSKVIWLNVPPARVAVFKK